MGNSLVHDNSGSFLATDDTDSSEYDFKESAHELVSKLLLLHRGDALVYAINEVRNALSLYSPHTAHPIDHVIWVRRDLIEANGYNPNRMAPVEKRLLKVSILKSGFTQPLVARRSGHKYIIVDGFHRYLVTKGFVDFLPVVLVSGDDEAEMISATIRHNRARGEHQVSAMAELVRELNSFGLSDERISNELGMDRDEVLRLRQISGISSVFSDVDFSDSWTVL